jgi:hypothetical protein
LAPEGMANRKELRGTLISLVMIEEVAVVALFQRRMSGNDIEADASVDQCGNRVDLLNEDGRRLQAGAAGDQEFEISGRGAERGRQHERIGFSRADVDQEPGKAEVFGKTTKFRLRRQVRSRCFRPQRRGRP